MSKLSLLEKNAYISMIIKDNGIWTHLAYTDHNAKREYILSDFTNISPLEFRLDDSVFSKNFWFEYFNNLEKIFSWNIVDRNSLAIFTFRKFKEEGDGISGIRIQIDDNQKFFDKIFQSVRNFSNDIALRVVDDQYMQSLLEGLSNRINYDDLVYVDMDLYDFSVFRITNIYQKDGTVKKLFTKSKIGWNTDCAVIDTINDQRFKAFLATDLADRELVNYWSNFVLDKPLVVREPNLLDIVRAYATIQNFSILRDNKNKLERFGTIYAKNLLIVSGYVSQILGETKTLLSVIDGLEFNGEFDCIFDSKLKLLSYGKTYVAGVDSSDVILTRKEVLSSLTKIVIPYVNGNVNNKVIFNGNIESVSIPRTEFFALEPQFTRINLPKHQDKLIVEGKFKNGAKMVYKGEKSISFISIPDSNYYSSLVIDGRPRPIVYGPDTYSNKIKLQKWINDNKA